METFLAACLITAEDFAALPLQQRAELVAIFRRSQNAEVMLAEKKTDENPLFRRSGSQHEDILQDVQHEDANTEYDPTGIDSDQCIFTVDTRLPLSNAEKYARLVQDAKFQACVETTEVLKFRRNRVTFPSRCLPKNLPTKCLQISDESALWCRRLYYWHEDEKQEKEEDKANETWSVDEVFQKILSLENVRRLSSYIQEDKVNLSASTFLKGFTSILSAIKVICGANLSGASTPELSATVTQVRNYVRDLIIEYQEPAGIASNSAEKQRLLFSMNASLSATEKLKRVYFILITESFWYLHNFGTSISSTSQEIRGLGFVVFATLMARPASRKNIITQLTLSDVEERKENQSLTVVFENHKTRHTTHCLVTIFPAWLTKVLHIYVKKIRPLLARDWLGSPNLLFPDTAFSAFGKFISSLGMVVNASGLRQLFCQSVGELNIDSAFFAQRAELQATAGHMNPRGRTIELHYELTAKPDREKLLQQYMQDTFCVPMQLAVKEILDKCHSDVGTPRKENPRRCREHTVLAWSSESDGETASEYTSEDEASPVELPSPQIRTPSKKRRRTQENNTIHEQKRAKRTVEMTAELKLEIKKTIQDLFRRNYLFADEVLISSLHATFTNFFGTAYTAESSPGQAFMTEAKKYAKGLLKNWVNILPCKFFTSVASAQALTTVGQLKAVVNHADVTRMLNKHPCYAGGILVSDEQLRRLRKDVEQRLMNFRAHMELGEVAGPTPDSKRHWCSLLSWRRSGFLCTRFENIAIDANDATVLLERDYLLPGE